MRCSIGTIGPIVVNKPAGLAVQGGSNTERHVDALLDALRFEAAERPRLVHRLDKDTSGVLLIARNAAAAAFFTRAFRDKTTRKIYWAIVVGLPTPLQGRIDLALAKQAGPRGGERVRADAAEGKTAITYYRVIDNAGDTGELASSVAGHRADPPAARRIARRSAPRSWVTASMEAAPPTFRAARRPTSCICMPAPSRCRTRRAARSA